MDIEQFLKKLRKNGKSDPSLAQCGGMLYAIALNLQDFLLYNEIIPYVLIHIQCFALLQHANTPIKDSPYFTVSYGGIILVLKGNQAVFIYGVE